MTFMKSHTLSTTDSIVSIIISLSPMQSYHHITANFGNKMAFVSDTFREALGHEVKQIRAKNLT
jgi:hypothetical protein